MSSFLLFFVSLFIADLPLGQPSPPPTSEFCNMETFAPNCSHVPDHVIVMETSQYGLMGLGRCLKVDYSKKLGCKADVLSVMDRHCSGKTWCQVRLPDEQVYSHGVCPPEVTSYLEASFSCVKVEEEISLACDSGVVVKSTSGFISSARYETPRCKWSISVPNGQKINLTLYDFFHYRQHQTMFRKNQPMTPTMSQQYIGQECVKYASVREPVVGGQDKMLTICGGGLRVRTVYLSESSYLEITIFAVLRSSISPHQSDKSRFLIKFEAVGCPDLDPSSSGSPWTVVREGDKATISCNSSLDSTRHHLLCQGNQWVGDLPSCSARTIDIGHDGWGLKSIVLDNWTSSQGLVTVIILGVALGVVLGVVMLVPLLFYFKRRDTMRHRMMMMASNGDTQLFDPNNEVRVDLAIDKSGFASNQDFRGDRNTPCGWYTQDRVDGTHKSSCCATSMHQIPQQTLLPPDECWPYCPSRQQVPLHVQDKNQPTTNNQTYLIKAPVVDHLEHDYDFPK